MTPQQAADIALAQWQAQREAGIPANERIVEMCGCDLSATPGGTEMTYGQLYACAGGLTISMAVFAWLIMWAIGLVSMPDPHQVAVEYYRPAHVWHAAEVDRRAP